MERLEHFFAALESVPGRTLTLGEWRTIFVTDHELGELFLRPTDRHAKSLPCGKNGSRGCLRRVVEHTPEDLVAVCGENPRACDTVPVGKEDLILYEVAVRRLADELANVLRFAPRFEKLGHATWSLGEYPAAGARRIAVLLALPNSPSELCRIVARLPSGPTIVFTPTRALHDRAVGEVVQPAGVQLLGLQDVLGRSSDGRLVADEAALHTLLECREDAAVFRRKGKVWELGFRGDSVHLPHEAGFPYIAVLLRFAGSELHVSELEAVALRLEKVPTLASGAPVLDGDASKALRKEVRRLKELRPEVTNLEMREEIDEEIRRIQTALDRAYRPDGKPKELGSESEKLRKSIRAAIGRAITSIRAEHGELANHLDGFIKSGVYLSYKPDSEIVWLTD